MPNQWVRGVVNGLVIPIVDGPPTIRIVKDCETGLLESLDGWDVACSPELALKLCPSLAEIIKQSAESFWPPAVSRTKVELLGPDECRRLDELHGLAEGGVES